ncbi:hypothetical protein CHS0354_011006 [Potamilus streckersoni]|nr:hypothetical protein CHS0354_011006 [Potamilus streckersoni]
MSKTLKIGEGSIICFEGCGAMNNITALSYYCTDYSPTEDWSTGMRSVRYNVSSIGSSIVFGFTGGDWITLLQGGNSWSMRAWTSLTIRTDTGRINHSPVTSVSPIIRVVLGCRVTINMLVSDADGDKVRCRWSTKGSNFDECAGICNSFPGARLNEITCTIEYTAAGTSVGYYGVAVQVEDFPASGGTVPYSSVPIQFLVQIYPSNQGCYSLPEFLPPTSKNGETKYLTDKVLFSEKIIAKSNSLNDRITEITTVSPEGMVKSALAKYTDVEGAWYVNITWIPSTKDVDQSHILCFSATDGSGLTSEQRCIFLIVTADSRTECDQGYKTPDHWFDEGQNLLTSNGTCTLVSSDYPVPIFQSRHNNIYVCANGIVSFDHPFESPGIQNESILLGKSILAPYLTDISLQSLKNGGSVTYYIQNRIDKKSNPSDLKEAANKIKDIHKEFTNFNPQFLLVVNWINVASKTSGTVTFQLILVTDGVDTFVFYLYAQGAMTLMKGDVFIGYSAKSGQIHKNYMSFTELAYSIDSNAKSYGYCGLLHYRLTFPFGQTQSDRQSCINWYLSERLNRDVYHDGMRKMPLCPCNRDLLNQDQFFTNGKVYRLRGAACTYILPNWQVQPENSGKMCCYNEQKGFINDGPFGFIRYHKDIEPNKHEKFDLDMKSACCSQGPSLCNLYYDVRPRGHCYTSFPSWHTVARGDPHITTLDGRAYTFNGWGEYTLITVNTTMTGTFDLQARTARAEGENGSISDATIFSAFAAKDSLGINIHVELNRSKSGLTVYAKAFPNKQHFQDYTKEFSDTTKEFSFNSPYLTLTRSNQTGAIRAFFSSGISIIVSNAVKMLSIEITIPKSLKGKTLGLMGNFDGNKTNDFMFSNGTYLVDSASEREIFVYGQTWMTNASGSAFRYPPGKTHKDFAHADFTPKFLDEADPVAIEKAKIYCGEDMECIFDYVFTGSKDVAIETRSIGLEANAVEIQIVNVIPSIQGPEVVFVKLNKEFTYSVIGLDDGSYNYSLLDTSVKAHIIRNADGSANVTAILSDKDVISFESLMITITDIKGTQGASFSPLFAICSGCSDHGECDYSNQRDDIKTSTFFKYAVCVCTPYWEGPDCERDKDGCATNPCSQLRKCIDNPVQIHETLGIGYNCSECPAGYLTVSDGRCEDINECNSTTELACAQRCINTEGSFRCDCKDGFRLVTSDQKSCRDINECEEGTSTCQQVCNNTLGGYNCSCFAGFVYSFHTRKCERGLIPSSCASLDCSATDGCIINQDGQPTCFCNMGYKLNTNGIICVDIDECEGNICQQQCNNTQGGYNCFCFPGYKLDMDKTTCIPCKFPYYGQNCSSICACGQSAKDCDPVKGCVCIEGWTGTDCDEDVDECQENLKICGDPYKTCINTNGSYTCRCKDGFHLGVDGLCQDIQECEDPILNNCQQICINAKGGYSCSCNKGYTIDPGNSSLCKDIDECLLGIADCPHICQNTDGSFTCDCFVGYILMSDRENCHKVEDPCLRNKNLNCSDICLFHDGRVSCSCNKGYRLGADNQTCIDINECENVTLNGCNQKCFNMEGGYVCSCSDGFKLDNDGRTCIACDGFHYGPNCALECKCGVGAERCDPVSGCVCTTGWTGMKCEADQDECSYIHCVGQNRMCVNTFGSHHCICKPGFKEYNNTCKDIDECMDSRQNDCEQNCINTAGSYACTCKEGFLQNGTQCHDINECQGKNDCSDECANTIGGYRCTCRAGFKINIKDKRTCILETLCQMNETSYCSAKNAQCAVVNGQSQCYCNKGYRFDTSNTTCEDIDECKSSLCDSICTNTNGTYDCGCYEGKKIASDGRTCIDCTEGSYGINCNLSCSCIPENTVTCDKRTGNCTCHAGFIGVKCEIDVNECEKQNGGCPEHSHCININGSKECVCTTGYIKTVSGNCEACDGKHYGRDCANECTCFLTNAQECNNVNGTCICRDGWQGPNCTKDLDECENPTTCSKPNTRCSNTHGSFVCACNDGYRIKDKLECQDIDECLEGIDNCSQACENTLGSFKCTCASGFSGDGVKCTECEIGHWGIGCKMDCSCNGTNSLGCDKSTGCLCFGNWTGIYCNQDTDECSIPDVCPKNSHCVNSIGSFSCLCNPGYTQNGSRGCEPCSGNRYEANCSKTCRCNMANSRNVDQTCDHETGKCICKFGWQGDCSVDRNECEDPEICSSDPTKQCQNTLGGFECVCIVPKDDGTCLIDVDECLDSPCENNGTCQNIYGSYVCHCAAGWEAKNCTKECSSNTFGQYCEKACNCSARNAKDSNQTCNATNGKCICKTGWIGDCSDDEDECVMKPGVCEVKENSGCYNFPGGHSCPCLRGFKSGKDSICEQDVPNVTTPVPDIPGQKAIENTVTFDMDIPDSININVPEIYEKYESAIKYALDETYRASMRSAYVSIQNISTRRGSLIVDYRTVFQDSDETVISFVNTTLKLAAGEPLLINGYEYTAQNLFVQGQQVPPRGESSDLCNIYQSVAGVCHSSHQCVVEGSKPKCKIIPAEDVEVLVGLGVGIPLLACAIVCFLVIVYVKRKRTEELIIAQRGKIRRPKSINLTHYNVTYQGSIEETSDSRPGADSA